MQNSDGTTHLMAACRQGDFPIIEYLMQHGALINSKDKNGCTAIMHLADCHAESSIKLELAQQLIRKIRRRY